MLDCEDGIVNMKLESLRIGQAREHDSPQGQWRTATHKDEVSGPLALGRLGLAGDEVADPENHGGPDKAVLAYSADHYPGWRVALGIEEFGNGALGENLSISGLAEPMVCLGDRYRLGTATVEVSQPRQPCWKQARRWGIADLVLQIVRSGKTGWYFRVLAEGEVDAGSAIELLERPFPDWTVARANEIYHFERSDRAAAQALHDVATLSESWKGSLARRIRGLG